MTTSDTFDGMIAVIQAFKTGRAIQWRKKDRIKPLEWEDAPCNTNPFKMIPFFNFAECEYRIKPEPREFWINILPGSGPCTFLTKEDADRWGRSREECIHVREVIE